MLTLLITLLTAQAGELNKKYNWETKQVIHNITNLLLSLTNPPRSSQVLQERDRPFLDF